MLFWVFAGGFVAGIVVALLLGYGLLAWVFSTADDPYMAHGY